jgi:formate hydrogenlyase subunit 7
METQDVQPAQHSSGTVGRLALPVLGQADQDLAQTSEALRRRIDRLFGRSLHIRHVDTGSCNACESEIKLLTSPYYDLHRLGLFFTPAPRHADLLLVTGPITRAMEGPLLRTYEAMPDPRLVVAVGACPCSGGVFGPSPYVRGSLAEVLPVDVFIPGCPPSPLALIHGLLLAINRAEQRLRGGTWAASPAGTVEERR